MRVRGTKVLGMRGRDMKVPGTRARFMAQGKKARGTMDQLTVVRDTKARDTRAQDTRAPSTIARLKPVHATVPHAILTASLTPALSKRPDATALLTSRYLLQKLPRKRLHGLQPLSTVCRTPLFRPSMLLLWNSRRQLLGHPHSSQPCLTLPCLRTTRHPWKSLSRAPEHRLRLRLSRFHCRLRSHRLTIHSPPLQSPISSHLLRLEGALLTPQAPQLASHFLALWRLALDT